MVFSEFIMLAGVAFGASWLTFFSGFGLGTMLTPVFYLIFGDLTLAISATAIVHLLNNVFKFALMQKSINWKIALPFGLAAIPAAVLGAFISKTYDQKVILMDYDFFGSLKEIQFINVLFGVILIGFALIELIPSWSIAFSKQKLWIGGIISGFFGGLSGHQGALRTAFLVKYQLDKFTFIATGIVIAMIIDISRIPVYFTDYSSSELHAQWPLITCALASALIGAITGKYFLKKIKLELLNIIISVAMIIFGITLSLGLLEKNETETPTEIQNTETVVEQN